MGLNFYQQQQRPLQYSYIAILYDQAMTVSLGDDHE